MAATLFTSESPAGKILAYLQRHGEATVKQLEELLGISTTAVREHLTHLEAKDLVATKLVRRGPGRPHALYFLTDTAQDLFPKEYDTLSTMLLREIASQEGPDRLQVLLNAVGARLAEEYGGSAPGAASRSSCRMVLHISALRVLGRPCGHASRLYQTPQRSRAAGSGEGPRLARRHPNLTVIATGHPLCRPRSARRSESSSSVVPFAKMKESARSSNTAVTRFSLERCSWILCMALSSR